MSEIPDSWKPFTAEDLEPNWTFDWADNDDAERYARDQEFRHRQKQREKQREKNMPAIDEDWHRSFKPWGLLEEEAEANDPYHRICIWCGKLCDSLEALDEHEDECAPD